MSTRVTIQDIADALGVSRNTVSKAINNTGILADATRDKVLQKATEMGYKQFSYMKAEGLPDGPTLLPAGEKKEIAFFAASLISNSHFASLMMDRFQREISEYGYSLTFHRINIPQNGELTLPPSFNKERTAGIICVEVFDLHYAQMLCDLNMPILFVDGPVDALMNPLNADFLNMNNKMHIFSIVNEMLKRGKTKIGFIGEIHHCQSFWERYIGFRDAMLLARLPVNPAHCLLSNAKGIPHASFEDYRNYLKTELSQMTELPDLFICANDFVAFDVMNILRELHISIPEDVMICGFDDSSESKLMNPPLTTIHIHTQIMGISAAQLLLSRIQNPEMNYRTMYTETSLILRKSTNN